MKREEWMFLFGLAVILALLGWWLKNWLRRLERARPAADQCAAGSTVSPCPPYVPNAALPLNSTPDGPVPFGYKTAWLAVRCDDPERVISALTPQSREPANWAAGLEEASASESGRVFVSSCLDGFVLVIGDIPFWRLERDVVPQFPEVQEFFCYQTSSCYLWGKYVNRREVRAYMYLDGELDVDFGPLTPEEAALGFARFRKAGQEGGDVPDEEAVLDIAAAWGIDPRFEKNTYPPSTGWLCTLTA